MRATCVLTALLLAATAVGQLLAESRPTIKVVPLAMTSAVSGQEMFRAYCAVCHGVEGKGDGAAAAYLNTRPTDLTRLAASNGGKYPELQVSQTLGAKDLPRHEVLGMPVWGELLRSLNSDRGIARIRVSNLTSYIESLQK